MEQPFWLLFLNIGQQLMSSKENFLVFGAYCKEDCEQVRRYILKTVQDLKHLEENIFEITTGDTVMKVEYKVAEIPNDMKMLCFLAGELSNSAHYFPTFANVNHADCSNIEKKIGNQPGDWKPYSFEKRQGDGQKAEKKITELAKSNTAKSTQRSNLCSYTKDVLKGRQQCSPIMSNYIERAKSEHLHLKNNTAKEIFIKILNVVTAESRHDKAKSFREINENTILFKFCVYIRRNMGCYFLVTKLSQWYNETGGKLDKDFTYRFRGKESYAFLQHFPGLIKLVIDNVKQKNTTHRLLELFLQFFHLRHIVSLMTRIESFDEALLKLLENHCRMLFKLSIVF